MLIVLSLSKIREKYFAKKWRFFRGYWGRYNYILRIYYIFLSEIYSQHFFLCGSVVCGFFLFFASNSKKKGFIYLLTLAVIISFVLLSKCGEVSPKRLEEYNSIVEEVDKRAKALMNEEMGIPEDCCVMGGCHVF